MENCYDLNLTLCDFIEHSEGKTLDNRASKSSVDYRIQVGIPNDAREGVIDTLHEV